ncbi:MAG: zinc ribbon domain-containing protein [Gammaproteobacteria bacterium]|nr:zinc ribbon domain-containing protein [Gammaproteobacteria bacterium]
MIKCKECGQDISNSAKTCPHCGVTRPAGQKSLLQKLASLVWGLVIFVIVITWLGSNDEETTNSGTGTAGTAAVTTPTYTKAQLDAVLSEVRSEPKVIAASWNNETTASLLASVVDDGTNRKGYAEYLCLVMAEHGVKGGIVRVMASHEKWKELGKAWCS